MSARSLPRATVLFSFSLSFLI
uniref:Uncharacterized protein n=1 Tax=Rhizophora mucronata TaxID=61149 RepID=A0A2P2IL00_RHIMU